MHAPSERRRLTRLALRWPLLLWRADGSRAVEGFTRNISSDGFLCNVPGVFLPGENLECCVEMPDEDQAGRQVSINLHCRVEVVRIEMHSASAGCGLACRLLSYYLIIHHRTPR